MTDPEFFAAFKGVAIPQDQWTHRAHVRAAYLHLRELSLMPALDAMREGIKKLNASHGLVETPERGYHETLTRAWLTVISATMKSRGVERDFEEFAQRHPHLLCSTLLRCFYSPKGMPPASRYEWVEPDVTPLPPG